MTIIASNGNSRSRGPALVGTTILAVLFSGCAGTSRAPVDQAAVTAPPAPPAVPRAETIARKVEQHARQTERAEGKQNLVKDEVSVKPGAAGGAVVEQKGEASYYAHYHSGRKTADGGRFDPNELTAAHPTLPLGSKAKITNLENGKSVEVTITDRGPHARGRDIDLSKAAAHRIGIGKKDGVAPVQIDAAVTPSPPQQP